MNTPLIDSSQSGVRRLRLLLIALAVLLPILLIVTVAWVIWFGPQRRIDTEIARIRAAGEPVTPDELDAFYTYPPGDEDVTNLWLDAIAPLGSNEYEASTAKIPFVGLGDDPPPPGEPWPDLEAAEAFLQQQAETLTLLYEASERDGAARYPLNFSAGYAMALRHTHQLRQAARLLRLDANVRAYRGDSSATLRAIRTLYLAARSLEREPAIISQLALWGLHQSTFNDIRILLPRVKFPEEDLVRFQADLRAAEYRKGLYLGLVGERVIGLHAFHDSEVVTIVAEINKGTWMLWRVWSEDDLCYYLESMGEVVAAAQQPWQSAIEEADRVEVQVSSAQRVRYLMTVGLMKPTYSWFYSAAHTTILNRAADAAIAIGLFRRRHDRLPESLRELVPEFLPQVPEDPFSGGSLKYKVEQDGYVFYSVGPDKIDDGGKDEKRQRGPDLVFRVALPKSK